MRGARTHGFVLSATAHQLRTGRCEHAQWCPDLADRVVAPAEHFLCSGYRTSMRQVRIDRDKVRKDTEISADAAMCVIRQRAERGLARGGAIFTPTPSL